MSSNTVHSYEFKTSTKTLDEVFKEQLLTLRKLALNQRDAAYIKLCYKWLGVLSKSSESEKLARNCLCALMQTQLQDIGYLIEPFTDLQNCNRNLEHILFELDSCATEQSLKSLQLMPRENVAVDSNTYNSHCQTSQKDHINMEINKNINSSIIEQHVDENFKTSGKKFLQKKLEAINADLKRELKTAHQLLEEKENQRVEENFRTRLLQVLEDALAKCVNGEMRQDFFENIFKQFECHAENSTDSLLPRVRECDRKLHKILHRRKLQYSQQKAEIKRQIKAILLKNKTKLNAKYRQRLQSHTLAYAIQLKLDKLKLCSNLRQTCIHLQREMTDNCMWHILSKLEHEYQGLVNENM